MIDAAKTIEGFGSLLVSWALWMNLWAGVLLVAAIAADRLLARRVGAAWRIALYAVVLARLALPADWNAPAAALLPRSTASTVSTVPVAGTVVRVPLPKNASVGEPAPTLLTEASVPTWRAGAAGAYILVAAGLIGVWLVRSRRLGRNLRSATPARPEWSDLVPRAKAGRVVEHSAAGPMVIGVLRPRIVLPTGAMSALSSPERARVIRHEAAHIARRDHLVAALIHAVTIIAWPVAAVWVAGARIRALMEQACDERALAGACAAERQGYARAMLDLACSRGPTPIALGFGLGVAARIRALALTRRWHAPAQGAVVLGLGLCMIACAGGRGAAEEESRSRLIRSSEVASASPAQVQIRVAIELLADSPQHAKLQFKLAQDGAAPEDAVAAPETREGVPVLKNIPIINRFFTTPAPPPGVNTEHLLTKDETETLVRAERQAGKVLSSPRIVVAAGERGTIRIGEGDAGQPKNGYSVTVTPTSAADGAVVIDLDFDEFAPPPNGKALRGSRFTVPKGMTQAVLATGQVGGVNRVLLITPEILPVAADGDGNAWLLRRTYPMVEMMLVLNRADRFIAPEAIIKPPADGGQGDAPPPVIEAGPLGRVIRNATPGGAAQAPEAWARLVPAGSVSAMYDRMQGRGDVHHVASPAIVAMPGETTSISATDTDKAHSPVGFNFAAACAVVGRATSLTFKLNAADGSTLLQAAGLTVPEGYVLVCGVPDAKTGGKFALFVLTPGIIYGPSDYPAQTSTMVIESAPAVPLPAPAK